MNIPWPIYALVVMLIAFVVTGNADFSTDLITLVFSAMTGIYAGCIYDEVCCNKVCCNKVCCNKVCCDEVCCDKRDDKR